MIDEIVAVNLGVIESARIEPAPGFTVITGETGTGKTLLLGALRLLLGQDAKPGLVGPFGEEAVAEGRFVLNDGGEVAARRTLPRQGRSRAYMDGSIASAKALEERVAAEIDLIGQHDQLSLLRPTEARALVDGALDEAGLRCLEDYGAAWRSWEEARSARDRLGGDRAALHRELDLVSYQATEIERASFQAGDDERLQQRADTLRHSVETSAMLAAAHVLVDNAREPLGHAVDELRRAGRLDPAQGGLAEQAANLADAVAELASEIRAGAEAIDHDPAALADIEERLSLLGELKRKYGQTAAEVIRFGKAAAARRDELTTLLARAEVVDGEVEAAESAVVAAGNLLTAARSEAARRLAESARSHLLDLGFADPQVEIRLDPEAPVGHGADAVTLLFSSDRRLDPAPVAAVASGGELSRLVLAIRLVGGSGEAAALVFDEIDSGVGGATALAVGRKLASLARERQVLCVTHLPQVAAFADRHYVVSRADNTAEVAVVEGEARVEELSRMLAGLPESEGGRDAAAELLALAT